MKLLPALLLPVLTCIAHHAAQAQCDQTAAKAAAYLSEHFISDGQSYRVLLFDDQQAEFGLTLYEGTTYRIASYAGNAEGQLQFSLFDSESNELFSNADQAFSPYWDFEVETTIDCRLKAQLHEAKLKSGCAVLVVGFKQ